MTDPASTVHPIPPGTKVKVTGRDEAWELESDEPPASIGPEYVVAYHVAAERAAEGRSFYYLDPLDLLTSGGTYPVLTEHVEVTKTAAEMKAAKPPAAGALLADWGFPTFPEGYSLAEADVIEGDASTSTRRYRGITDDGVRFGFDLTVSNVEREDY